ncbi:hypothetical protein TrispH2_006322 [Trichoplax sp. H2]|nr:hypothetical protein TrispH2_006322 [Trichoplax sp. H2]|eukprot:RDD41809.1 hypothetical protein TrispH2_006322 [Trichoplax sp. H2]
MAIDRFILTVRPSGNKKITLKSSRVFSYFLKNINSAVNPLIYLFYRSNQYYHWYPSSCYYYNKRADVRIAPNSKTKAVVSRTRSELRDV